MAAFGGEGAQMYGSYLSVTWDDSHMTLIIKRAITASFLLWQDFQQYVGKS